MQSVWSQIALLKKKERSETEESKQKVKLHTQLKHSKTFDTRLFTFYNYSTWSLVNMSTDSMCCPLMPINVKDVPLGAGTSDIAPPTAGVPSESREATRLTDGSETTGRLLTRPSPDTSAATKFETLKKVRSCN